MNTTLPVATKDEVTNYEEIKAQDGAPIGYICTGEYGNWFFRTPRATQWTAAVGYRREATKQDAIAQLRNKVYGTR